MSNNDNILLSRKLTGELAGVRDVSVQSLISRGRLTEVDALIGGTVRKGVTLASAAAYWGWSPSTVDAICFQHGVDPLDPAKPHHYLVDRREGAAAGREAE